VHVKLHHARKFPWVSQLAMGIFLARFIQLRDIGSNQVASHFHASETHGPVLLRRRLLAIAKVRNLSWLTGMWLLEAAYACLSSKQIVVNLRAFGAVNVHRADAKQHMQAGLCIALAVAGVCMHAVRQHKGQARTLCTIGNEAQVRVL
jgi:hypothetical protein